MKLTNENLLKKNSTNEKKSETISELAQRHLKDENHTTTDEELKNAKIEIDNSGTVDDAVEKMFEVDNSTVFPSTEKVDQDVNEESKDGPNNLPNPYNVLGG